MKFRLGDKTTNDRNHYGQIEGFPQLFLIADSWGNVLSRLAEDIPYPKWYTYRDPLTIDELNILPENIDEDNQASLKFKKRLSTFNLYLGFHKKTTS